ncbi:hypothetical protein HDU96_005406 [Phlyctochytrium bullatum]|nr:hypothetical protein HDU96_005406 [Phlyctochytrium bullatum]
MQGTPSSLDRSEGGSPQGVDEGSSGGPGMKAVPRLSINVDVPRPLSTSRGNPAAEHQRLISTQGVLCFLGVFFEIVGLGCFTIMVTFEVLLLFNLLEQAMVQCVLSASKGMGFGNVFFLVSGFQNRPAVLWTVLAFFSIDFSWVLMSLPSIRVKKGKEIVSFRAAGHLPSIETRRAMTIALIRTFMCTAAAQLWPNSSSVLLLIYCFSLFTFPSAFVAHVLFPHKDGEKMKNVAVNGLKMASASFIANILGGTAYIVTIAVAALEGSGAFILLKGVVFSVVPILASTSLRFLAEKNLKAQQQRLMDSVKAVDSSKSETSSSLPASQHDPDTSYWRSLFSNLKKGATAGPTRHPTSTDGILRRVPFFRHPNVLHPEEALELGDCSVGYLLASFYSIQSWYVAFTAPTAQFYIYVCINVVLDLCFRAFTNKFNRRRRAVEIKKRQEEKEREFRKRRKSMQAAAAAAAVSAERTSAAVDTKYSTGDALTQDSNFNTAQDSRTTDVPFATDSTAAKTPFDSSTRRSIKRHHASSDFEACRSLTSIVISEAQSLSNDGLLSNTGGRSVSVATEGRSLALRERLRQGRWSQVSRTTEKMAMMRRMAGGPQAASESTKSLPAAFASTSSSKWQLDGSAATSMETAGSAAAAGFGSIDMVREEDAAAMEAGGDTVPPTTPTNAEKPVSTNEPPTTGPPIATRAAPSLHSSAVDLRRSVTGRRQPPSSSNPSLRARPSTTFASFDRVNEEDASCDDDDAPRRGAHPTDSVATSLATGIMSFDALPLLPPPPDIKSPPLRTRRPSLSSPSLFVPPAPADMIQPRPSVSSSFRTRRRLQRLGSKASHASAPSAAAHRSFPHLTPFSLPAPLGPSPIPSAGSFFPDADSPTDAPSNPPPAADAANPPRPPVSASLSKLSNAGYRTSAMKSTPSLAGRPHTHSTAAAIATDPDVPTAPPPDISVPATPATAATTTGATPAAAAAPPPQNFIIGSLLSLTSFFSLTSAFSGTSDAVPDGPSTGPTAGGGGRARTISASAAGVGDPGGDDGYARRPMTPMEAIDRLGDRATDAVLNNALSLGTLLFGGEVAPGSVGASGAAGAATAGGRAASVTGTSGGGGGGCVAKRGGGRGTKSGVNRKVGVEGGIDEGGVGKTRRSVRTMRTAVSDWTTGFGARSARELRAPAASVASERREVASVSMVTVTPSMVGTEEGEGEEPRRRGQTVRTAVVFASEPKVGGRSLSAREGVGMAGGDGLERSRTLKTSIVIGDGAPEEGFASMASGPPNVDEKHEEEEDIEAVRDSLRDFLAGEAARSIAELTGSYLALAVVWVAGFVTLAGDAVFASPLSRVEAEQLGWESAMVKPAALVARSEGTGVGATGVGEAVAKTAMTVATAMVGAMIDARGSSAAHAGMRAGTLAPRQGQISGGEMLSRFSNTTATSSNPSGSSMSPDIRFWLSTTVTTPPSTRCSNSLSRTDYTLRLLQVLAFRFVADLALFSSGMAFGMPYSLARPRFALVTLLGVGTFAVAHACLLMVAFRGASTEINPRMPACLPPVVFAS